MRKIPTPLCCGGAHTPEEHEAWMEAEAERDLARSIPVISYSEPRPRRPAPPSGPRLGDAPEAARIMGISLAAFRRRSSRHQLPRAALIRTGRRIQYRLDLLVR